MFIAAKMEGVRAAHAAIIASSNIQHRTASCQPLPMPALLTHPLRYGIWYTQRALITKHNQQADAITRMETHVLDTLQWRSMHSTAWTFLGIIHARLQLPAAAKAHAELLIVR